MEEGQRRLLQQNRVRLVKDLKVAPLWDLLLQKDIFSQDMIEEIQSAGTRRDQARQLVTDLQTRGRSAFPLFVACLEESGQAELAAVLREGCRKAAVEPRHISPVEMPSPARKGDEQMPRRLVISHQVTAKGDQDEPHGPQTPGSTRSGENRTGECKRNCDKDYILSADPCGLCLIINNVDFLEHCNLSRREGSDVDCEKLQRRFRSFRFQVQVRRNLKGKEIHGELQRLAGTDHSHLDCCLVVILSHGCEARHIQFPGGVYGTDGASIPVEKIVKYFDGSQCPSLRGKPKLFIIQACGGDQKDKGFELHLDAEAPAGRHLGDPVRSDRPLGDPVRSDRHLGDPVQSDRHLGDPVRSDRPLGDPVRSDRPLGDPVQSDRHLGDPVQSDATPFSLPAEGFDQLDAVASLPTPSDILVAYSTFPGFVSWRNKQTGTWYVETLDSILGQHAASDDLQTLLVMVANEVSAKGVYKQIPGYFNYLRKRFFFKTS
ncbi:caspase-9 [Rhinatrema bivittatum]|uniref:caspase-9 n=1 Tax=Rhinatrema bivittatum TaxID=194408 RepID=UPI00112E4940|nr:caspase-9 [Rhinatrema bivittatum]